MSTIVIVDDEESIRHLCAEIFTRDGHEVVPVRNVEELFAFLRQGRPDLILMDIGLPGEKGLSLLKRMPNMKENRIPVVIFSGLVTPERETEAYEAGAVEVIQKGASIAEIRQKVNKIIGAKQRVFEITGDSQKKETILVVDDEDSICRLLCGFFQRQGFKTLAAYSGEEALEIVAKEKPRMILLDVRMPGMDGLETLKRIHEITPEAGVVMATGLQDEAIAKKAAELGAYAYVTKPFDMKYLEMVVLTRLLMAA